MEFKIQNPYIAVHLFPDEKLLESLSSIVKEYKKKTMVILSGIGQLKNITLGYFKEKGNYTPQQFFEPHELLSLNGTLILQDDMVLPHLHAVIGAENKQTYGGHLIEATIEVTNEIILLEIPLELSRRQSLKTGLMELNLTP